MVHIGEIEGYCERHLLLVHHKKSARVLLMTTLCPAMDAFGLRATSVGVSAEATELQDWVRQSFDHYLEPRLQLLFPEIQEAVSEDGSGVDEATIRAAELFAYCLPRFGPVPEVSVDPDGEISFDWIAP